MPVPVALQLASFAVHSRMKSRAACAGGSAASACDSVAAEIARRQPRRRRRARGKLEVHAHARAMAQRDQRAAVVSLRLKSGAPSCAR